MTTGVLPSQQAVGLSVRVEGNLYRSGGEMLTFPNGAPPLTNLENKYNLMGSRVVDLYLGGSYTKPLLSLPIFGTVEGGYSHRFGETVNTYTTPPNSYGFKYDASMVQKGGNGGFVNTTLHGNPSDRLQLRGSLGVEMGGRPASGTLVTDDPTTTPARGGENGTPAYVGNDVEPGSALYYKLTGSFGATVKLGKGIFLVTDLAASRSSNGHFSVQQGSGGIEADFSPKWEFGGYLGIAGFWGGVGATVAAGGMYGSQGNAVNWVVVDARYSLLLNNSLDWMLLPSSTAKVVPPAPRSGSGGSGTGASGHASPAPAAGPGSIPSTAPVASPPPSSSGGGTSTPSRTAAPTAGSGGGSAPASAAPASPAAPAAGPTSAQPAAGKSTGTPAGGAAGGGKATGGKTVGAGVSVKSAKSAAPMRSPAPAASTNAGKSGDAPAGSDASKAPKLKWK